MSTRTRKDWILWAQLGCALVVTFHAEYTLALAAGVHEYIALAVPGALDLYVIRALQKHRDVFLAVLVMVIANVASHLVTAGLVPVGWGVYSAVGGTVPLLLWRGHALRYTRTRKELLWGTQAGAVSAPVPGAHPVEDDFEYGVPGAHPVEDDPEECGCLNGVRCTDHCDCRECTGTRLKYAVPETYPPVPDHVPGDWMDDEYPETYPSTRVLGPCSNSEPLMRPLADPCSECGYAWGLHPEVQKKRGTPVPGTSTDSPVPYLKALPDLPAEYAEESVHSDVLKESDMAYLPGATKYVDDVADPTIRGLKAALCIGQERAERLLAHLGVRP